MSTDRTPSANPLRGSLRLADKENCAKEGDEQPRLTLPRQFVNFTFYRARPEWRLLDAPEREGYRREFLDAVEASRWGMMIDS